MAESSHPAPLLLGPYELTEPIATGGMAEVYLARRAGPHGFEKVVAVKRILPQLAVDVDFVAMFIDEARVCARLAHPNIVQVFDFGEQDGELYMAMEYVGGTTAARLVRAAAGRGEDIPLEVSLHIVLSILRGLDYAHTARDGDGKPLAIVHRDVSPGNVLIDRSGAVKLTDFGIARAAEIERRTDAGQLKGKLGYMSPEQVVGKDLDARSDLFTVAIVLAELLMLRPMFAGSNEIDVLMRIRDADLKVLDRSDVPEDLKAILFRALARERSDRYVSAAAFMEALEGVVRHRRLQVGPSKLALWLDRYGLAQAKGVKEGDSGKKTSPVLARALSLPPKGRTPAPQGSSSVPAELHDGRVVDAASYSLRTPSGQTLGPFTYGRLVELYVTGAVLPRALVSRDMSPFREASSYEELTRFVESSALRWDDSVFGRQNNATRIDPLLLPTRLFQIALFRETGALYLRDGARRKKVYVVEGVPDFVMSTDKRELLGEHLIESGIILRGEVETALLAMPRFHGRLGDALCGLGVLRPIDLFRAVQRQMEMRYLELFKWRRGEVAFVRGARSHEETFPVGFDPFALALRGLREGFGSLEIEALMGVLEEDVIEPTLPPPVRLEAFRFGPAEEQVIRSLRARMSIRELVANTGRFATREEAYRAIFCALCCDLVSSKHWTAYTSAPPLLRPAYG
jgi:serine/threonine protein kinase